MLINPAFAVPARKKILAQVTQSQQLSALTVKFLSLLLERDRFPRFHIGESLLASVNEVLDAVGAGDLVRAAGFPRKWGATFMTPDGRVERFADFAISPEVPAPQTWQVPREDARTRRTREDSPGGWQT